MQNHSSATGVGGFSPINIPQLKVWLDAAKGVTSAGGLVSTWQSQTAPINIHWDQATDANKPTLVASGVNGLPIIRFGGDSRFLTKGGDASGLGQYLLHLLVVKANGATANSGTPYSNNAITAFSSGNYGFYLKNTSPISLISEIWAGPEYTDTFTFDTTAFHILTARHDGAGIHVSVDGGTETNHVQSNAVTWSGTWYLGKNNAYGNFDIAEMLFYTTYVNTTDVRRLQVYLASKYNITLAS